MVYARHIWATRDSPTLPSGRSVPPPHPAPAGGGSHTAPPSGRRYRGGYRQAPAPTPPRPRWGGSPLSPQRGGETAGGTVAHLGVLSGDSKWMYRCQGMAGGCRQLCGYSIVTCWGADTGSSVITKRKQETAALSCVRSVTETLIAKRTPVPRVHPRSSLMDSRRVSRPD